MRLPFKVLSREQLKEWLFQKIVSQFGPLLAKQQNQRLEKDIETVRLLLTNLTKFSPGPEWAKTTQETLINLSKQMDLLRTGMEYHQKMFEDLKKTEGLWRSGQALKKLH